MAEENKTEEVKKESGSEGGGEKEMGLAEINKALKKIMPEVEKLMSHMDKMKPSDAGEEGGSSESGAADSEQDRPDGDTKRGDAKDAEEEKKDEAKAKDGLEKSDGTKSDGKAADAKGKDNMTGKGMDMREVILEVAQRDKLANQLSHFVGAFDASEMTLADVAKYGAEKLGMTGFKDNVTAVKAYLHGRPVPTKAQGYAMDQASANKGANQVDAYINGTK